MGKRIVHTVIKLLKILFYFGWCLSIRAREAQLTRERREKKGCDNPKEDRKKKDERFRAEGEERRRERR